MHIEETDIESSIDDINAGFDVMKVANDILADQSLGSVNKI